MVDSSIPSRPPYLALRIFLFLFALSEFLSGLIDLPSLQNLNPNPTTGWHVAGYISDARTVLVPAIAAAAFGFALMGMLSRSVAAMAALLLVKAFAAIAWAIALWGATVPLDVYSVPILAPRYVYPLLGVAALALLWRGRLGLAGTLTLLPTGVTWLYWIIALAMIATNPD
jgi:hypothetical protein